jgi:hypothetical protein
MIDHATVLLYFLSKHRLMRTTINELSEMTGIPRVSLSWLLADAKDRGQYSILSRVSSDTGFDYYIYKDWRGSRGNNTPRLIIDVEKMVLYNRNERIDNEIPQMNIVQ